MEELKEKESVALRREIDRLNLIIHGPGNKPNLDDLRQQVREKQARLQQIFSHRPDPNNHPNGYGHGV